MIQFSLRQLKREVKNLLHLPVTRGEVLMYARQLQKEKPYLGLCELLDYALLNYEIWLGPSIIFPKFSPMRARHFGAYTDYGYWWEKGRWDTGRLDFLNWLIEQYKDDKINIRKL